MIAVAAGAVCREGRIMICQRKPGGHQPLKWEFPGGKLEAGESPEQALARELREELGIEARVGRILDAQRIADDGRDLLVLFYFAEIASGEPEPLDCNAVAWAEPAGLLRYDLAESDRAAALRMMDRLASGAPRGSGAQSDI